MNEALRVSPHFIRARLSCRRCGNLKAKNSPGSWEQTSVEETVAVANVVEEPRDQV